MSLTFQCQKHAFCLKRPQWLPIFLNRYYPLIANADVNQKEFHVLLIWEFLNFHHCLSTSDFSNKHNWVSWNQLKSLSFLYLELVLFKYRKKLSSTSKCRQNPCQRSSPATSPLNNETIQRFPLCMSATCQLVFLSTNFVLSNFRENFKVYGSDKKRTLWSCNVCFITFDMDVACSQVVNVISVEDIRKICFFVPSDYIESYKLVSLSDKKFY